MDAMELAASMISTYNTDENWEIESKLGSVALVLMALEIAPTEAEWRNFILLSGINIFDSEIRHHLIDSTCLFHYSGLMPLDELEDDTWLDSRNPQAFEGVTDGAYQDRVQSLRLEAQEMREMLLQK